MDLLSFFTLNGIAKAIPMSTNVTDGFVRGSLLVDNYSRWDASTKSAGSDALPWIISAPHCSLTTPMC